MPNLTTLNLPLDLTNSETAVMVEAGLNWIANNTTFVLDPEQEPPANVKLFLVKFCEIYGMNAGITSESIAGMSQSFSTDGAGVLIRQYANDLLGEYFTGNKFVSAQRRWRYGR